MRRSADHQPQPPCALNRTTPAEVPPTQQQYQGDDRSQHGRNAYQQYPLPPVQAPRREQPQPMSQSWSPSSNFSGSNSQWEGDWQNRPIKTEPDSDDHYRQQPARANPPAYQSGSNWSATGQSSMSGSLPNTYEYLPPSSGSSAASSSPYYGSSNYNYSGAYNNYSQQTTYPQSSYNTSTSYQQSPSMSYQHQQPPYRQPSQHHQRPQSQFHQHQNPPWHQQHPSSNQHQPSSHRQPSHQQYSQQPHQQSRQYHQPSQEQPAASVATCSTVVKREPVDSQSSRGHCDMEIVPEIQIKQEPPDNYPYGENDNFSSLFTRSLTSLYNDGENGNDPDIMIISPEEDTPMTHPTHLPPPAPPVENRTTYQRLHSSGGHLITSSPMDFQDSDSGFGYFCESSSSSAQGSIIQEIGGRGSSNSYKYDRPSFDDNNSSGASSDPRGQGKRRKGSLPPTPNDNSSENRKKPPRSKSSNSDCQWTPHAFKFKCEEGSSTRPNHSSNSISSSECNSYNSHPATSGRNGTTRRQDQSKSSKPKKKLTCFERMEKKSTDNGKKVSPLSIYAKVTDNNIYCVKCRRFKKRCKPSNHDEDEVPSDDRVKISLTFEELAAEIARELVDMTISLESKMERYVAYVRDLKQLPPASVHELLMRFCQKNGQDFRDFNDVNRAMTPRIVSDVPPKNSDRASANPRRRRRTSLNDQPSVPNCGAKPLSKRKRTQQEPSGDPEVRVLRQMPARAAKSAVSNYTLGWNRGRFGNVEESASGRVVIDLLSDQEEEAGREAEVRKKSQRSKRKMDRSLDDKPDARGKPPAKKKPAREGKTSAGGANAKSEKAAKASRRRTPSKEKKVEVLKEVLPVPARKRSRIQGTSSSKRVPVIEIDITRDSDSESPPLLDAMNVEPPTPEIVPKSGKTSRRGKRGKTNSISTIKVENNEIEEDIDVEPPVLRRVGRKRTVRNAKLPEPKKGRSLNSRNLQSSDVSEQNVKIKKEPVYPKETNQTKCQQVSEDSATAPVLKTQHELKSKVKNISKNSLVKSRSSKQKQEPSKETNQIKYKQVSDVKENAAGPISTSQQELKSKAEDISKNSLVKSGSSKRKQEGPTKLKKIISSFPYPEYLNTASEPVLPMSSITSHLVFPGINSFLSTTSNRTSTTPTISSTSESLAERYRKSFCTDAIPSTSTGRPKDTSSTNAVPSVNPNDPMQRLKASLAKIPPPTPKKVPNEVAKAPKIKQEPLSEEEQITGSSAIGNGKKVANKRPMLKQRRQPLPKKVVEKEYFKMSDVKVKVECEESGKVDNSEVNGKESSEFDSDEDKPLAVIQMNLREQNNKALTSNCDLGTAEKSSRLTLKNSTLEVSMPKKLTKPRVPHYSESEDSDCGLVIDLDRRTSVEEQVLVRTPPQNTDKASSPNKKNLNTPTSHPQPPSSSLFRDGTEEAHILLELSRSEVKREVDGDEGEKVEDPSKDDEKDESILRTLLLESEEVALQDTETGLFESKPVSKKSPIKALPNQEFQSSSSISKVESKKITGNKHSKCSDQKIQAATPSLLSSALLRNSPIGLRTSNSTITSSEGSFPSFSSENLPPVATMVASATENYGVDLSMVASRVTERSPNTVYQDAPSTKGLIYRPKPIRSPLPSLGRTTPDPVLNSPLAAQGSAFSSRQSTSPKLPQLYRPKRTLNMLSNPANSSGLAPPLLQPELRSLSPFFNPYGSYGKSFSISDGPSGSQSPRTSHTSPYLRASTLQGQPSSNPKRSFTSIWGNSSNALTSSNTSQSKTSNWPTDPSSHEPISDCVVSHSSTSGTNARISHGQSRRSSISRSKRTNRAKTSSSQEPTSSYVPSHSSTARTDVQISNASFRSISQSRNTNRATATSSHKPTIVYVPSHSSTAIADARISHGPFHGLGSLDQRSHQVSNAMSSTSTISQSKNTTQSTAPSSHEPTSGYLPSHLSTRRTYARISRGPFRGSSSLDQRSSQVANDLSSNSMRVPPPTTLEAAFSERVHHRSRVGVDPGGQSMQNGQANSHSGQAASQNGLSEAARSGYFVRSTLPLCNGCGVAKGIYSCLGCKKQHYCSSQCQNSHWEQHSKTCEITPKNS